MEMAATGSDRDARAVNRQLQKEFGEYRVKIGEKLGSLQAGQQALQEGQKSLEAGQNSLEAKLEAMIAILQLGKSNIEEGRAQFEAQDSPIQPARVQTRQGASTSAIPALNSQVRPH